MRAPPSNMHVNIRFKATGHSMVLGNFAAGDIARAVPIALARHLVEDAGAAEYMSPPGRLGRRFRILHHRWLNESDI